MKLTLDSVKDFIDTLLSSIKKFPNLISKILPFHASAWKAASEPIQHLLNIADIDEQDRLTKLWRENAQSQLNIICATSALMGAVIASAFSWPVLEALDPLTRAIVQAIWYASLLFGILGIGSATQLAVALSRLCCYSDGLVRLRKVLGWRDRLQWRPRKLQLVIWQTPAAMLNASLYTFALGLVVLVWASAANDSLIYNPRIVLIFTTALVYTLGTYLLVSIGLYRAIAET